MASIKRRPERGNRWQATYRDPAGRERAKLFDRKVDAERWLTSVEHAKATGAYVDPQLGRTTLADWAERWRQTRVAGRASSRARDESYLRTHVLPAFGRMPLSAIRQVDVQTWVSGLRAAAKAPATVRTAYQIMAKIMRSAVSGGLIAASPCVDIDLPRIERDEMRFLAPAEVAALAKKIDPRYRAMVLLGAYGGFRLGEMVGLKIGRVDQLRRRVDVVEIATDVAGRVVWGAPKTRAGRRSVTLPAPIMAELVDHMGKYASGELVFPAPDGGVLRVTNWRRRVWNPATIGAGLSPWDATACKVAGFHEHSERKGCKRDVLRPHDLRHTAVALWIASGANMLEVSKRAGHASTTFTLDRYGHLFPDADEQLADRLEAMIAGTADSHATVTTLEVAQ